MYKHVLSILVVKKTQTNTKPCVIKIPIPHTRVNPLPAMFFKLHFFYPLEVESRYRDQKLEVSDYFFLIWYQTFINPTDLTSIYFTKIDIWYDEKGYWKRKESWLEIKWLILITLKYFCINHGDQRVLFNLKSS